MRPASPQPQQTPKMPTDSYLWSDPLSSADPSQYLVGGAGRILVVDDEVTIRDLLSQFLNAQGFECRTADSGRSAIDEIQDGDFDLVISDIRMPSVTGLQLLEHVHDQHPTLPVIMITAVADLETAVDAMKQGAADYITKPFDLKKVVGSVRNALQTRVRRLQDDRLQSRLQELVQTKSYALDSALRSLNVQRDMTLEALVRALDARESETRCHSLRVQSYAIRLARQFDVDGEPLEEIARGALLHDIGKIGISDAILLKPGKLTEQEWVEMRKHPVLGYEILRGIDFLDGATKLVLRHHERWDGSGYPDGMRGKVIPFGARLFGIVDSYDAMTSDRPYRKALPTDHAREELSRFSGVLYDPEIVEGFLAIPQEELDEISRCCSELIDPA
jgi:putative nucleotidyltransferase with HDIG domain